VGLDRQHGVAIGFGLAVEQLLADRRDHLHVDAGPFQPRQHGHQIERRARSLGHHVSVPRLAGREIANDVQALGGGPEIRVGERAPIGHAKVGARDLDDDDPHLLLAGGDLRRGEVSGSHVVVVPETEIDHLIAREQLPHLGREDAKVRARVGGGFRTGMPGEDVQDARAELAVLVLLAPHARGQVHQRREGAVGAAERPHPGELVGVEGRALAHEADGAGGVARFLDGRLEPRPQRVALGIVVSPDTAVLEVDGFREIRGQGQHAVVRDVVQPLDDLGYGPARPRHLARLAEQRDLQLFLRAGDGVLYREGLRLLGEVGDAEPIVQEWIVLHVDPKGEALRDRLSDLHQAIGQPVPETMAIEH
jgi:hypothetical protein